MEEFINRVVSVEEYHAVAQELAGSSLPVVWGRYSTSNVANARKYELSHSRHNQGIGLRFTARTMRDGSYVFAYMTEEQLDTLHTTMTYAEWVQLRGTYGKP